MSTNTLDAFRTMNTQNTIASEKLRALDVRRKALRELQNTVSQAQEALTARQQQVHEDKGRFDSAEKELAGQLEARDNHNEAQKQRLAGAEAQSETVRADTERLRGETERLVHKLETLRAAAADLPALQHAIADLQRNHVASREGLEAMAHQTQEMHRGVCRRHEEVADKDRGGALWQIKLATMNDANNNNASHQQQQQPQQQQQQQRSAVASKNNSRINSAARPNASKTRRDEDDQLSASSASSSAASSSSDDEENEVPRTSNNANKNNNASNVIRSAPQRKNGSARSGGPVFLEAADSIMLTE